jgi:hypothetical protein
MRDMMPPPEMQAITHTCLQDIIECSRKHLPPIVHKAYKEGLPDFEARRREEEK